MKQRNVLGPLMNQFLTLTRPESPWEFSSVYEQGSTHWVLRLRTAIDDLKFSMVLPLLGDP